MKELLPLKKKKKVYVHSYVVQDLITVRDINSKWVWMLFNMMINKKINS